MGAFLASVRLTDGRIVEPVAINSRPDFMGVAVSSELQLEPIDFETDDVADLIDASQWDTW